MMFFDPCNYAGIFCVTIRTNNSRDEKEPLTNNAHE